MDSDFLRLARRVKEVEGAEGLYLTAADVEGSYLKKSGGTMTGAISTPPDNAVAINIGNDACLADRNSANTMFVEGLQNSDRGYINFGQVNGNTLGAVCGGNLTWRGNKLWDAGSLVYSQGTWTPRVMGFNNWVDGITASAGGRYVRMGNIVHVNGHITLSSKNGMSGNLGIVDLPFVCGGDNSAGSVGISLNQSTSGALELHIDPGSNIAHIMKASNSILTADYVLDNFAVYGFQITYSLS